MHDLSLTHTHNAMAVILKMTDKQFVYQELCQMRSLPAAGQAVFTHRLLAGAEVPRLEWESTEVMLGHLLR